MQSERTIHGIRVTLQGIQTLAFPESASASGSGGWAGLRWEEKIIMNKSVEIVDDHAPRKHARTKGKGKERERDPPSPLQERERGRSTAVAVAPAGATTEHDHAVNGLVAGVAAADLAGPGHAADGAGPSGSNSPAQQQSPSQAPSILPPQNKTSKPHAPDVPIPVTNTKHEGLHLEKGVHGSVCVPHAL